MISLSWLALAHDNFAVAPPLFSKNSILMLYFCPAVKEMLPLFSVGPWLVQLSTNSCPLTHSRTPSSDMVKKVYDSVYFGRTWPVQRAENVSMPTDASGEPLPQSKFTIGSMRSSFSTV